METLASKRTEIVEGQDKHRAEMEMLRREADALEILIQAEAQKNAAYRKALES